MTTQQDNMARKGAYEEREAAAAQRGKKLAPVRKPHEKNMDMSSNKKGTFETMSKGNGEAGRGGRKFQEY